MVPAVRVIMLLRDRFTCPQKYPTQAILQAIYICQREQSRAGKCNYGSSDDASFALAIIATHYCLSWRSSVRTMAAISNLHIL